MSPHTTLRHRGFGLPRRGFGTGALALLAGCATVPSTALSPADRAAVSRVQAALAGLHGFRATFIQTGPGQGGGAGTAWYDPGKLRLVYATPQQMVVVAADRQLVARRASDGATTRIALAANPLGLLLAQPLHLTGGAIRVTDAQRTPGILQVSLARADDPAQGLLTLIFHDREHRLSLIGLEAVDRDGARTRFHLFDAQSGLTFPPGLFTPPA